MLDALVDRFRRVLEVLLLVLLAELHAFVLRVQLPENKTDKKKIEMQGVGVGVAAGLRKRTWKRRWRWRQG